MSQYIAVSLGFSICLGLWAILIASNMNGHHTSEKAAIGVGFCLTALVFAWPTGFTVIQYVFLFIYFVCLIIKKPGKIHAFHWGVGLSLAPYLLIVSIWIAIAIQNQSHFRERFPMVSLADRLGMPPVSLPEEAWNQEMKDRLANLEEQVNQERETMVENVLKRVHETTVRQFLESEGLGQGRRISISESIIDSRVKERTGPYRQEGPSFDSNHADLSKLRRPWEKGTNTLDRLHAKSVVDFSFPEAFGYIQDRDHVAGFQSHRFGDWSEELSHQNVTHVDLVSLLLHDPPVVYHSDELPRMDRVQSMPTRPLNSFESASLERIKKGEDLIVADLSEGWLMMGAIRNLQQCVQCHGGKRGDLLGAFAYSIRKRVK